MNIHENPDQIVSIGVEFTVNTYNSDSCLKELKSDMSTVWTLTPSLRVKYQTSTLVSNSMKLALKKSIHGAYGGKSDSEAPRGSSDQTLFGQSRIINNCESATYIPR